ncbi:unnamed protein product [Closterium sp. NIES-54]
MIQSIKTQRTSALLCKGKTVWSQQQQWQRQQHMWPQLQQWRVQLQRLQQPPQRGPDGPGQYTHRYVGAATAIEPCVSSLGACVVSGPGASEVLSVGAAANTRLVPAFVAGSSPTSPTARLSFTLDSGASSYFFRDCTNLTPLHTPVTVALADPSVGFVVADSTTTLPSPAAPSGFLTGYYTPSLSRSLPVASCTVDATGAPLATFHREPGSSLYSLHTGSHHTESGQVRSSSCCVVRLSVTHPPVGPGDTGAGATGGAGACRAAGVGATGGTGAGAAESSGGPAGAGAAGGTGAGGATGAGAPLGAGVGTSGDAGGAPGVVGAAGVGADAGGAGAVPAGFEECPPPVQSESQLQLASPLPSPSPYADPTGGLAERREPESLPASPVRPARTSSRVPRQHPPAVPGTHQMALHPSTASQRVPLPSPPASSLPALPDLESDSLRAASPTVPRFLATAVTDPPFESTAASALVAELVDFTAHYRLDYAASLIAESASVCSPSVGGECAFSTDVLEDRQEEFQCFAAALPHLVSTLLAPEGDPAALDIPTPRSYAEVIEGPYSSQWQAAMDAEMASWKSTGTYVDEVPPPGANIVSGIWIFKVKRPPGSLPVLKARYVARGFSQRQGVDYFQTFSPTPKMTTLWVLLHVAAQRDYELHSLDFSTAFLQGSLHEEIWLRRPPG